MVSGKVKMRIWAVGGVALIYVQREMVGDQLGEEIERCHCEMRFPIEVFVDQM